MKEERHVRKSNIFVEGRYRFGVNEQRILLSVISKIKIADVEFKPYRLQWKHLKKITSNQYKNADDFSSVCERLKNRTIVIRDGDQQHGFGFLSGWTIEPGKWIDFRIDPCMKDMLLDLLEEGKFVLYKLECILGLGSAYSIRLYELLKAHEWKQQPVEINLKDLKWTLAIEEGSKADKRFDYFRSSILERARKDLEKHTDIKFEYRKVLELRKVVALQFIISENKKYQTTVSGFTSKGDSIKNGDTIILDGKEYVVHGDSIMLSDGAMPIGSINRLYRQGRIEKK